MFFRNSECLACQTSLGHWPEQQNLLPLQDAGEGRWQAWGSDPTKRRFARCANLHTSAACNWLVTGGTDAGWQRLCRCCRLTRTVPDLTLAEHPLWWNRIEVAKWRLVSALIGLGLPAEGRDENPTGGMAFDLLRTAPSAANVVTGHADGVITLDVEEADDAWRERRRTALAEPCRTLPGHLRRWRLEDPAFKLALHSAEGRQSGSVHQAAVGVRCIGCNAVAGSPRGRCFIAPA